MKSNQTKQNYSLCNVYLKRLVVLSVADKISILHVSSFLPLTTQQCHTQNTFLRGGALPFAENTVNVF